MSNETTVREAQTELLIDNCSYCDRKIPFGEIYFAMALNKEKLIKGKKETEIIIVQSDTVILWCKDCFPKFNPIPENKEVENK
jgi:hypothetical protein